MTAAVCIDDCGGMTFNNRRVSRDSSVIEDITQLHPARVFADPYSAPLFEKTDLTVSYSTDFLTCAEKNDICFIENRPEGEWFDKSEKIIFYRWNRRYPSELRLSVMPESDPRLRLLERTEFPGTSHKKITREVYEKCR